MNRTSVLVMVLFFGVFVSIAQEVNQDSCGTFIDRRDGQEYKWIRIGDQVWMAQNLNISKGFDAFSERLCYKHDERYCQIYGSLYTDFIINHATLNERGQSICPLGWHLPSADEWLILFDHFGGTKVAGTALKEQGTKHWKRTNKSVNNISGFSGLPGGVCLYDENSTEFVLLRRRACFWSSTDTYSLLYSSKSYRVFCLNAGGNSIMKDWSMGISANYVRCIKDQKRK